MEVRRRYAAAMASASWSKTRRLSRAASLSSETTEALTDSNACIRLIPKRALDSFGKFRGERSPSSQDLTKVGGMETDPRSKQVDRHLPPRHLRAEIGRLGDRGN